MRDIKIKKRHRSFLGDKPWMRTALCVGVLLLVAVVSHRAWFNPSSILTFGDWQYRPDESVRQMFSSWQSWVPFEGFGAVNILMSGFPFRGLAWAALTNGGLSYDTAVKITLLIPIAFGGFLTSFLLARRLFKDRAIAFIVALFYGTTPYYLSIQAGHFPIDVVGMLVPLLVYLLDVGLETNAMRYWVAFTLIFSIGIFYEVRIMYIASFILVGYCLGYLIWHKKDWKKYLLPLGVIGSLTLLINLFWLLPTKMAAGASIGQVAERGLFGNSLFNIMQSFTVMKWNWSGGEVNRFFIPQPVPAYLWIVPAIAFAGFLIAKKRRAGAIIFTIMALVGVFLTKQSSGPLTGAYSWLYNNFPGFVLFREASKFYLIVAFGFLGMIGYTLLALQERWHDSVALRARSARWWKYGFVAVFAALALVAAMNLKPAFTEELAGTFHSTPMPQDYQIFKNFVKNQPDFFRTYWVPRESWWGFYDNQHPRVRAVDTLEQVWAPFTDFKGGNGYELARKSIDIFQQPFSNDLFDNASIKYIVVPTQNDASGDDFYSSFGNDRQYFINALNQVPFLKRVNIGTKQLAVYENTGYRPYVSAATSMYKVTNTESPAEQTSFITSFLGKDFNLDDPTVHATDASKVGAGNVQTLFDFSDNHATLLQDTTLEQTTTAGQGSYIQIGQRSQSLAYELATGKKGAKTLNLYKNPTGSLWANGQLVDHGDAAASLGSKPLTGNVQKDYYLGIGDKMVGLDTSPGRHSIGNTNQPVTISRVSGPNLVTNPSFEQGTWQKTVGDCNNYDNAPQLSMDLVPRSDLHSQTNKKALALYAQKHTACTTQQNIPVSSGKPYMLQFSYRNQGGQQIGYKLEFNDPSHTVAENRIAVTDTSWHVLDRSVTAPKGATKVSVVLEGYPSTDYGINSSSYFDDVSLNSLDTVFSGASPAASNKKMPVPAGKVRLSFQDSSLDPQNRIDDPSFEQGLWRKKVDDCHDYDSDAQISMRVDPKLASSGKQSMQLEATRHIACTNQSDIKVKGNTPYYFNFDYYANNTSQVRYRMTFDDPGQTVYDRYIDVPKGNVWQHVAASVQTPPGASSMTLTLYASPNSYGTSTVKINYDNFRLTEIPAITQTYHLVTPPATQKLSAPANITYNASSPTRKYITVHGAKTPFYLTMNETFDKHWLLQQGPPDGSFASRLPLQHPLAVPASDHVEIDGPLNAWYIDPAKLCGQDATGAGCVRNGDGSYDLQFTAEFTPQHWFTLGLIVSGTTFAASTVYVIYAWTHRRKPLHYRRRR